MKIKCELCDGKFKPRKEHPPVDMRCSKCIARELDVNLNDISKQIIRNDHKRKTLVKIDKMAREIWDLLDSEFEA